MKKQNVLITPTLLNSFEFALNAPPSWKTRAMNDLIAKIRREKTTFPAWVKKGILFEDAVYKTCKRTNKDEPISVGSQTFRDVCEICRHGTFQNVFKKTLMIDDLPVLIYNKTDVAFPDKILDIKTTLNWKGDAKYLKGWQHKLYLHASGKRDFEYLIVQWEDEDSNNIIATHRVMYTMQDHDKVEKEIVEQIKVLFDFLKQENLYEDYYYTFSNNRRF